MPHNNTGRKRRQREIAVSQHDMERADQSRVRDQQPWRRGFTFPQNPTVRIPDYTLWQAQKLFDRSKRK